MSRRRTTTLLPAAALTCLLALAGCGGASSTDSPSSESTATSESSSTQTSEAEPLALVVEGPQRAKCMVPNAEVLATQDTAFEGTVTALSDGTATLQVDRWFTGDAATDTVIVSTPSEQLQDLLVAVDFQRGRTYLVSSLDGRVSLCGFTNESDPGLEALYEEAFAG